MLSDILDTKGEGVSPFHNGDVLEIWVLNPGFWCVMKLKLTLILAENDY